MSSQLEEPKACWVDMTLKIGDSEEPHESGSRKTRIQFYNDNASSYDDDMQIYYKYKGPILAANAIHEWLEGDASKSILDVGGGSGLVVEKLRKLANYTNVDGLDPATEFLEIAQSKGYYNKIFPMYFYNGCGIEENSYDVVCVCGAMLPGHIKAESLREMCKIVKPGGAVVIVMKESYMLEDDDLKNVRPTFEAVVSEKKWEVVKDMRVDSYFNNTPGYVFVFKKL